jgi:hypothetical protein
MACKKAVADAHRDHAVVMPPLQGALDENAASQNDRHKHGCFPQKNLAVHRIAEARGIFFLNSSS